MRGCTTATQLPPWPPRAVLIALRSFARPYPICIPIKGEFVSQCCIEQHASFAAHLPGGHESFGPFQADEALTFSTVLLRNRACRNALLAARDTDSRS